MATKTKTPIFFKDNYGFMVTFETKTNLSSATSFMVRIVKPAVNGVRVVIERPLTAAAILDPIKGIVGYTIQTGDFNLKGGYLIQLEDTTTGRRLSTEEQKFRVIETVERFE